MSFRRILGLFLLGFLVMHLVDGWMKEVAYLFKALVTLILLLTIILLGTNRDRDERWKERLENLGLRRPATSGLWRSLVHAGLLILAYPLISRILHVSIILSPQWFQHLAGLFLTAGLSEELLFRGLVLGQLRQRNSFRKATGWSLLLFTLAHTAMFLYMPFPIAMASTLLAAGLSIPMSWLYESSGKSLWGPILLHVVIRTVGFVLVPEGGGLTEFALAWMTASLVIPLGLVLLDPAFRKAWRKD